MYWKTHTHFVFTSYWQQIWRQYQPVGCFWFPGNIINKTSYITFQLWWWSCKTVLKLVVVVIPSDCQLCSVIVSCIWIQIVLIFDICNHVIAYCITSLLWENINSFEVLMTLIIYQILTPIYRAMYPITVAQLWFYEIFPMIFFTQ